MLIDDVDLVTEAQKCGAQAFAPIIERYKEAVFAVALARLRRFHDAKTVGDGCPRHSFYHTQYALKLA